MGHVHTAAKFVCLLHLLLLNRVLYTHNSLKYGSHNRINFRSDNRIYRNSTQCVRNRTEQLVVNDVFECVSVYSSVCEMQENNSERSLNWAQG